MSIILEDLTKRYAGHPVVNRVSLEIGDGQFFVLLGPSGSGKSTILRLIAGLAPVDGGRVLLHGRDVTREPPQRRDVGFVFQNYALFRHMTVADNVEFALRIRKVPRAERRRRCDELLALAGLAGLGERLPDQLSGGQQQRVALARALAHRPGVLLLDEPFGALDARIRVELRRALKTIQRELGVTTIFVTHDQEEAFELADRLGVMNVGRLLEVGPPDELYLRPQAEFTASFLGTANLLVGQCTAGGVQVGPLHFPLATEARDGAGRRVQVLFRPEDVALAATPQSLATPPLVQAEVEQLGFAGSFQRLRLRLPPIPGVRAITPAPPYGSDSILVEAVRSQDQAQRLPLAPGERVWVGVRRVHALTHPGLSFLVIADRRPAAPAALDVAGQIARLAHARTTVLGCGLTAAELQERVRGAREALGGAGAALEGRVAPGDVAAAVAQEVERRPHDLVVVGMPAGGALDQAEEALGSGEHHLLLVRRAAPPPSRVLICVAGGEPGKEDVLFAGRLVRHLGAEATLLTILPQAGPAPESLERYLEAGRRTLAALGVTARLVVRRGAVRAEIAAEFAGGGYDLLVLGAPLGGARPALGGGFAQLIAVAGECPVLVIRSHYVLVPRARGAARVPLAEEVL